MDKIYSRKRIAIPKMSFCSISNKQENMKREKSIKIILILIVAICTMVSIINSINPIINRLCIDASKKEATLISNRKTTEVMANYKYEDMIIIYRDNNNNITMMKSNIKTINAITSDVAIKIQEEFEKNDESVMNLKLREFNRNQDFFW